MGEQAGRIGLKPCLILIPGPLAKANGNEAGKFIAVPFMGRINKQMLKALAKIDKRLGVLFRSLFGNR